MGTVAKVVVGTVVVLLACFFGFIFLVAPPSLLSECSEVEISKVMSQDGQFQAVLFERNCGATVGLVHHVNVLPIGDSIVPEAGEPMTEGTAAVFEGSPSVAMRWLPDDTLQISFTGGNVVSSVSSVASIRIVLQEVD